LIGLCWLLSENRRHIAYKQLGALLGLELLLGAVLFGAMAVLPDKVNPFLWFNSAVLLLLEAGGEGASFLFGPLLSVKEGAFVFALEVLPIIVFFSALVSVLYYWGIMGWVIAVAARALHKIFRISGAEALCCSSNLFVGVESLISIRPYLASLSRAELTTIFATAMATIASSVLALYVFALQSSFSAIAAHLLSASVLSIPAAILFSRLLVPQTEQAQTEGVAVSAPKQPYNSTFEAIIRGAQQGTSMVVGIATVLIAVLGIVSLIDSVLGKLSSVEMLQWLPQSLPQAAAFVFYPFTLLIGVEPADTFKLATLLGTRLFETEVPAYFSLAEMMQGAQPQISRRSAVIAAYSLCGFAHVASVAIFSGAYIALVPGRSAEVSRLIFKSLLAATCACLCTGAMAGLFFNASTMVLE